MLARFAGLVADSLRGPHAAGSARELDSLIRGFAAGARAPQDGLQLRDFVRRLDQRVRRARAACRSSRAARTTRAPRAQAAAQAAPGGKKVYIESYGCQMNVSDSEVLHVLHVP